MIEIHYPGPSQQLEEIAEQLTSISLAYRLIHDEGSDDLKLVESKTIKHGSEEIRIYLQQLIDEKDQWWFCGC
jgi:hypothetical protein